MLNLVEAKSGPATVCMALTVGGFSIFGLMLFPHGEPLGLYRVSSFRGNSIPGCLFSPRTGGDLLIGEVPGCLRSPKLPFCCVSFFHIPPKPPLGIGVEHLALLQAPFKANK